MTLDQARRRALELLNQGKEEDAERCLELTLRRFPYDYVCLTNMALLCQNQGRDAEARRFIDRATPLAEETEGRPWVRYIRSQVYLKDGDWEEGWQDYEWRFAVWRKPPQAPFETLWHGEYLGPMESLNLWNEQGLGDQIMMVRFLSQVKKRSGAWVRLVVSQELVSLFQGMADEVSSRVEPLPGERHCPLFSLPRVLEIRPENLCGAPYLPVMWAPPRNSPLKAGFCYRGSGHEGLQDRDLPDWAVESMLCIPDVEWVPLQYGEDGFLPKDFRETANALLNVDFLVTTDTSMVHLAGAMGVPTFLLLRFQGDFRWLKERDDTPWYDSVKLIRQTRLHQWTDVLVRLKNAIEERVNAS